MATASEHVSTPEQSSLQSDTIHTANKSTSCEIHVDQYLHLAKCFITKGRGNRPRLPTGLKLTNCLLLQLKKLQEEGKNTCQEVNGWFEKLFPDISFPSNRISLVIDRTSKRYKKLEGSGKEVLMTFLHQEQDLDSISDSLTKLGLKRGHLLAGEEVTSLPDCDASSITNQTVIDLEIFRSHEHLPKKFTVKWLQQLTCGFSSTAQVSEKNVKKIMELYNKLNKQRARDPQKLLVFLATQFVPDIVPCASTAPNPVDQRLQQLQSELKKTKDSILKEKSALKKAQETVTLLSSTVLELSEEKNKLLSISDSDAREKHLKDERILKLKTQFEVSRKKYEKKRRALNEAQRKLVSTKRKEKDLANQLQEAQAVVDSLRKQLLKEQAKNVSLQQENEQLLHHDNHVLRLQTRICHENNRFSDEIRRTVLGLQAKANVPASRCSEVIQTVAENLFGMHIPLKDLPCLQTAINISDEGAVLSKIQATEAILKSSNCTLHTDGTSRNQQKIVSQQITLDTKETLSLGFFIVASEDAATLLDITIKQLEEMSHLYADSTGEDQQAVLKDILHKISSLMSDRAAVMKKFDAQFREFLQTKTGQDVMVHFLHCNAHFLLGFSRYCELGLKTVERSMVQSTNTRLGRDQLPKFSFINSSTENATSRLIRTSSDVTGPRGDQQNGCRQEWLAYCEEHGIKSYMTSYRSNRFNSFFEGAAAVIHHRDMMLNFFPSLSHTNLKTQSVTEDLKDDRLLVLVAAVALLYIRFTGPYWEVLQSNVKYTEFHTYVRGLTIHLDRSETNATDLLDPNFVGIFGGEFELGETANPLRNSLYRFLASPGVAPQVAAVLHELMDSLLLVALNQLEDFLAGGAYGGPPAVFPEGLEHCPLTNLLGENVFGDYDFDMNKHRYSTNHHRSTRHMIHHNKTPQWLCQKNVHQTARLMEFARKRGHALRIHHRQQEKLVMLKIRQKLIDNEKKKIEIQAKQAEQKAQLIRRISNHGGPCVTVADVDALRHRFSSRKDLLEAVKDQIRYQKTVLLLKGNLKLTAPVEDLIASLKTHLVGNGNKLNNEESFEKEQQEGSESEEENFQPSTQKRARHVEADGPSEDEFQAFAFTRQGQWVAVYYDDKYYVGQVVEVASGESATVQYLQQTKGRQDYFKWPQVEDVATTSAEFVFRWDFEVVPVSSDGRLWKLDNISDITSGYNMISGHVK